MNNNEQVCERELGVRRALPDAGLAVRGTKLRGYAIVYNAVSVEPVEVGGVYLPEVIDAGAFDASLASGRNVSFTFQHEDTAEYGDTASGTLRLLPDSKGIAFELDLPAYAATLRSKIERGLIRGMSFGFVPKRIEVKAGVRHIVAAELLHISSVYSPAYSSTTVNVVRSSGHKARARELELKAKLN